MVTLNSIMFRDLLMRECHKETGLDKKQPEQHGLPNNAGFTLIEMLITIAILAIVLAIAAMSSSYVKRERVTSKGRELVAELQRLRSDAITQGTTINIHGTGMRFTLSQYVRFTFNDQSIPPNPPNYQYDNAAEELNPETRDLAPAQVVRILIGATLFAPAFPNNVIIFDHFGFPRQPDWTIINDMAVVLQDPSMTDYTRCVRIQTGRIREGIWNAGTSTCIDQ